MNNIFISILAFISIIALVSVISLLTAFPVMWCWNYAVVFVFGLPKITWGMAWCLMFLTHILFYKNQDNES